MITVSEISKSFGSNRVLRGVTFSAGRGQFLALLGVNGAGKTTLIRILATLSRPTSGTVVMAGFDIKKSPVAIRKHIGIMSHMSFLYNELSAEENLRFYGVMYGVKNIQKRVDELLEQVGLASRRHDLVRTFSSGMQKRLSLARAILHQPDILLLDEPFAGLDINAMKTVTHLLKNYVTQGTTVLLTTHDIDYALTHAQRTLVLKHGQVVIDKPVTDVTRSKIVKALS
jgi:heme exporter protein A